jgi:hypothetical protein
VLLLIPGRGVPELALDVEVEWEQHRGDLHDQLSVAPLFSSSSPPFSWRSFLLPSLLFSLRWGVLLLALLGRVARPAAAAPLLAGSGSLFGHRVDSAKGQGVFCIRTDDCSIFPVRVADPTARSSQLSGHAPWPRYCGK